MPQPLNQYEARFMQRVERRAEFLKTLFIAEIGVYLSPDEGQRRRSIEALARMMARQSELAHLGPETLRAAADILRNHFEAMQRVLPHDVQYRNRLKRDW